MRIKNVEDHQLKIVRGCDKTNNLLGNPFQLVYTSIMMHLTDSPVLQDQGIRHTVKSHLELEPEISNDQLIILSQDDGKEMKKFSQDKVYVLGNAILEREMKLNELLPRGSRVVTEMLPMKKYLKVKKFRALEYSIMLDILATFRDTGCWIKALTHVPKGYHMGLTKEGKDLCNYNRTIIDYFDPYKR